MFFSRATASHILPRRHPYLTNLLTDIALEMHCALYNQDLLFNIAMYLHMLSAARNPDLLAFVLTCRSFCKPGLDVLWMHIHDPFPLMRLAPGYMDVEDDYMPDESWATFLSYSKRIRFLSSIVHNYDDTFYRSLRTVPGNLLPGIRHLVWYPESLLGLQRIYFALSHFLHTLELWIPAKDGMVIGAVENSNVLLTRLSQLCPNLENLHFDNAPFFLISPHDVECASQALCSFHRLRILDMKTSYKTYPITLESLRFLANLQTLEHLAVYVDDDFLPPWGPHLFILPSPFPSLVEISLTWDNTETSELIGSIIASISSPLIKVVNLFPRYDIAPSDLEAVLEAVGGHQSVGRVGISHVHFKHDSEEIDYDIDIPDRTIFPLFRLRHIFSFELEGFMLEYEDLLVYRMTQAWRNLITVIVSELDHHGQLRPAVDILDLQCFAKSTPYIREIKLPFISRLRGQGQLPSAQLRPGGQVNPITLHHGWTISPNALLAASFLYIVFGSLNLVGIDSGGRDDLDKALRCILQNRDLDGRVMWHRLPYRRWDTL
ncbi:hypothetical protein QCA50_006313 [Cerrena zonata]|uniref:F-box domain-containing protein n=1 Tax=Cerrena zonata TaxID=2478898 RepID=A0AAW0FJJ3_9APHY